MGVAVTKPSGLWASFWSVTGSDSLGHLLWKANKSPTSSRPGRAVGTVARGRTAAGRKENA